MLGRVVSRFFTRIWEGTCLPGGPGCGAFDLGPDFILPEDDRFRGWLGGRGRAGDVVEWIVYVAWDLFVQRSGFAWTWLKWLSRFGFGFQNRFVREFRAEGLEALEFLDGAAVKTLGLGLVAKEELPGIGLADHLAEALGEGEVAILGAGDVDVFDEVVGHGTDGSIGITIDGEVEGASEEAGFQAGDAEEGLLGESDALDGEEFLGVDGVVDGDEVGFEVRDGAEFFEADDAEDGSGEAVFAGILGGAGLPFGGARAGRSGGIGAVGVELFFGRFRLGHVAFLIRLVARERRLAGGLVG
jgi:hypothetical protein